MVKTFFFQLIQKSCEVLLEGLRVHCDFMVGGVESLSQDRHLVYLLSHSPDFALIGQLDLAVHEGCDLTCHGRLFSLECLTSKCRAYQKHTN